MKDIIFKNRDDFFQFIIIANIEQIREINLTLREILQDCKKYNLLSDNEVNYFYENNHHIKPQAEFLNDIQQKLLLHRVKELKIKNKKIKQGGFINIENNSIIQGNNNNGLQQSYIVDIKNPMVQDLIKSIAYLLDEDISVWNKIDIAGNIIREKFIEKTEDDDVIYISLLKKYTESKLNIPISEYLKIKKGMSQEISLLTVIALNSINIESYYYNANVQIIIEDIIQEKNHSVVLCNINDKLWIIDNYNRIFNKTSFDDVLNGIDSYSGLMYDLIEDAIPAKGQILSH